jgi:hypothetical protein
MTHTGAQPDRVADHRFYYAISIALACVVFAGFARTYYLKAWYDAPQLSLLLHLHGAVMTLWYALFIVQVRFVERGRVAVHRRLGMAGVVLAGLVAILGTIVPIGVAKRALLIHPDSFAVLFRLAFQLFGIVLVFVILVSLALYLRHRPDYHKRLMVLAMLSVLGPAVTRLPVPFLANHDIPITIAINALCVLICVAVDTLRNRRFHISFGWGASVALGSLFLAARLAHSPIWLRTSRWLLR